MGTDPPEVLLADDMDALHWRLAKDLVARLDPSDLPRDVVLDLREALLDERWADAVLQWMRHTKTSIDVYPSMEVTGPEEEGLLAAALQFTPLFQDP